MGVRSILLGGSVALLAWVSTATAPAGAASWCANPIYAHEWGVHVFSRDGTRQSPVGLPTYLHRRGSGGTSAPVRHMPADSGIRFLPVLQFYADREVRRSIPVAVEVAFAHGDATVWYPQVDARRPARTANSATAQRARAQLQAARQALDPYNTTRPELPSDPTSQLVWDRLELTPAPVHGRQGSSVDWVRQLRDVDALWVNRQNESERFVFYEAGTREAPVVTFERGPDFAPDHRRYLLRNGGSHGIHDVFLIHREGRRTYVAHLPAIPAGRAGNVVLEEHRVPHGQLRARTRGRLRTALTDRVAAAPTRREPPPGCVMQRDPATPFEVASGHRLYRQEVDAILRIWGPQLFDAPGTTLVYREDDEYVAEEMRLSLFTDMYHYIDLRRLSLAVVHDVALP